MFIVKIDDGFCEWTFNLEGSGEYCIQDLIDAITNVTLLRIESEFNSRKASLESLCYLKRNENENF